MPFPSPIPTFIQVDLLLAEFFASIAITVISHTARRSLHQSNIPGLRQAFLLFGASNTVFCYRRVKQAARGGNAFDVWKATVVWAALVLCWAMFAARPQEGTWRACLANTLRATLIVPFILAQVVLTRGIARKLGYFELRRPPTLLEMRSTSD
ncbi:hypothetical protein B0H19DRAFT_1181861 [Mycena capillaripes]|nr:hypothetical protein B0H19DRAFT_1181861 [Mycena capillaripes]